MSIKTKFPPNNLNNISLYQLIFLKNFRIHYNLAQLLEIHKHVRLCDADENRFIIFQTHG